MARRATRKFYHFNLQAHGHHGDYDAVFAALRSIPSQDRLAIVGQKRIFLSDVTSIAEGYVIRVLSIQSETDYTTFDIRDFSVSDSSLPENKRFAVAAHGFFISGSRRFVFEYVRGGPKAEEAIEAIQQVLRSETESYSKLRLVANPVIDERFLAEVDRLERVRLVRIDVSEPNASWADWHDPLHELGDESGAAHIALEARAPRGESLNKKDGILQILHQALKSKTPHIDRAVVEGRLPGESANKTLRTDREQEFDSKKVEVDSGGSANIISVTGAFNAIAQAFRKNSG